VVSLSDFCLHICRILKRKFVSVISTVSCFLDLHESVHRDIIMKVTNKMQLYRIIYYS